MSKESGAANTSAGGQTPGRRKVRFRPPGLKPSTKVGRLGPYRDRLGVQWVIAAVVLAVLIAAAGYFALFAR